MDNDKKKNIYIYEFFKPKNAKAKERKLWQGPMQTCRGRKLFFVSCNKLS